MKKRGFTLAEVLITLVIIGVIGALTVPSLIQNTQKQEYVTGAKKAYSTLSQAAQMIIAEEGPAGGETGWASSQENVYNLFKKHLINARECGSSTGCYSGDKGYKRRTGGFTGKWDNFSGYLKLVTADGMQIVFNSVSSGCDLDVKMGSNDVCGIIYADVNGAKKPNEAGRDLFTFVIKNDGLYPAGCDIAEDVCSHPDITKDTWGHTCTCKVIRENAMNY